VDDYDCGYYGAGSDLEACAPDAGNGADHMRVVFVVVVVVVDAVAVEVVAVVVPALLV
jgi:hypothetical protein